MNFFAGTNRYMIAFVCVMVIFYSVFYIFTGNRGLPRYFYLQKELKTAYAMDNNYIEQREKLENKVKRLSSESLDLDLLEEQARLVLKYVEQDEFVIIDVD